MDLRTRGIVVAILVVVSSVFVVIDAIDNGFTAWNGVTLACSAIVLLYALSWIRRPPAA